MNDQMINEEILPVENFQYQLDVQWQEIVMFEHSDLHPMSSKIENNELLIELREVFRTSSNSLDPFGLDSFRVVITVLSNGLITTDSNPLISPRQNGHNGGGFALF